MRFPEDKIKDAILHPDPEIRDRSVSYFARSFSADPAIVPLVIQAVESHDKNTAYQLVGDAGDLRQSEGTIAWYVKELNDPQSGQYRNYASNLSRAVVAADPVLLLPHEAAILESPHFVPHLKIPFVERLRMRSWDEAKCWQELERFCEDGKDKQSIADLDYDRGRHIVEALARHGPACEPKVRALLSQEVDDFEHNLMRWLEPLAIRLAGQARLEPLVPLLVLKLHTDDAILGGECEEALTRIGTPAVVRAVAEAFPAADDRFRSYAAGTLERIPSDLTVETCLSLFRQPSARTVRLRLAEAMLGQFALEGIEAARQLLVGQELDFEDRGLRGLLLQTCTITGERFAEYDAWLAAEKSEREEHFRKVKELEGDPLRLMLYAMEKLAGKKSPDVPPPRPTPPAAPRLPQPPIPPVRRKAGRNDPCPCGSGKKFKNCCLKK